MNAFALCALAALQSDPTVEEVIRKIEEKTAAVRHLTADIELDTGSSDELALSIGGRMEFSRTNGLRRLWCLWARSEGMLLLDQYLGTQSTYVKGLFAGSREGSLFMTCRMDKVPMAHLGFVHSILLFFGLDTVMADMALYPRAIERWSSSPPRAFRRTEDGRERLVLQATTTLSTFTSMTMTYSWFFDATTGRLERLEVETEGKTIPVRPQSYVKIQGVEIPERVEFQGFAESPFGRGLVLTLRNVSTAGEPKSPEWISDAALPAWPTEKTQELRDRLKRDPGNATVALQLTCAALAEDLPDKAGFKEMNVEICGALEKAVQAGNPSPLLLTALYCAYATKEDSAAAEKIAQTVLEKKLPCPETLALRSCRLLKDRKYKELAECAALLEKEGTYRMLSGPLLFSSRVAEAADAKAVLAVLAETLSPLSIPARLRLLAEIEPPPARHGKGGEGLLASRPADFLAALEASGKPEALLLVARVTHRAGRTKEATGFYAKLAANAEYRPHLLREFQMFCTAAKGDALPLLELVVDDLNEPQVLLSAADAWFEEKNPERYERVVKRALEILKKEKESGSRSKHQYRDPQALKPLLKKLVDASRLAEARELLLAFADRMNASSFLYDEGNTLTKILPDDDSKYEFVRMAGLQSYSLQKLALTPATVFAIIQKRLAVDSPDEVDVEALGAFVTDFQLRQAVKIEVVVTLLERAVTAHPKRAEFHERLGDARLLDSKFGAAAASYRETLRLDKESKREDRNFGGRAVSATHSVKKEGTGPVEKPFDPSQPLIAKLARALLKDNKRDEALAAVEQYLKDFDEKGWEPACEAYEFLDQAEPLMALQKKILLSKLAKLNQRSWEARNALDIAVKLGRLYLKHRRYEEAYAVSEHAVELAKSNQNDPQLLKSAEELRTEAVKNFGEDDLVARFLKGTFPAPSEETKKRVAERVAQLEDEAVVSRQEAEEALRKFGPEIAPLLAEAMKARSGEAQTRLRAILLDYARKDLRDRFLKS